jgi:hypothetical protein
MLETLLRMYVMALAYDVRSPMPHLVGPPGSGKSTMVEQLADQLAVNLHVINVSRLSPLEVEGVQMPHGVGEEMVLKMLPATFWTSLEEGDILLMDEFLRGFPEVYSSLLDIFTSRRVGAFRLPKVFIVGASNSVIAYDFALEDRLLHIPVTDPRSNASERKRLASILLEDLGLHPDMADSMEMTDLLNEEVLPTYDVLDVFKKKGTKVTKVSSSDKGRSLRNLIGQAQLRQVQSSKLVDLIEANNQMAVTKGLWQYVFLLNGKTPPHGYVKAAVPLQGNSRLTHVQAINLDMNLQLVELEDEKKREESP